MSDYKIENFRPTQADIESLVVSVKAGDIPVGSLLRRRAGGEWHAPEMPTFKTMDGLEHKDRDWVEHYGDPYADVVLTPTGLELLAETLIKELANQTYFLQIQVGRRELDERYHIEFLLDRAMDALQALGSPRWRELEASIEPALEKAISDAKDADKEDK